MENKYLEMVCKLYELEKWLKENGEELKGTGINICIYIDDRNQNKADIAYVGDIEGLMRLHMHAEDALKENADAVIKEVLGELLKDLED